MTKSLNISAIIVFFVLILFSIVLAESLTVTTYYPSPYGSYDEIRVYRMSIGSVLATTAVTDGNLIVSGMIGIGYATPLFPLDVNGNVRIVGNLDISGTLTKGGGSFLIDHPLDPENKILRHSFIESPDMKNIYDGVVMLDKNGEFVVNLPDYFEALNEDFRYQLTPIVGYSPIYIKQEIKNNKFIIAGGKPNQKVSWMVTGIRKDAYALKNRIVVEEEKGLNNNYKKEEYIHPEVFIKE